MGEVGWGGYGGVGCLEVGWVGDGKDRVLR